MGKFQEIETTPSTFQEVEEEVQRNWLELPPDVMSLILLKLGTIDILGSAQWVCTSWWKLSKQPHLFRSVSMQQISAPYTHVCGSCENRSKTQRMVEMMKEAVDRSGGQLVEITLVYFANDELLHYISQKSESLKCLRIVYCYGVNDDGLAKVCQEFPLLEELALVSCRFSDDMIEFVGILCPYLKSFRLNYTVYTPPDMLNGKALAISQTMHELHNLLLFGDRLTNGGLRAILHGCPRLQSLDLRRCINLEFEGDLELITPNIKIRVPYDSTDDLEYAIKPYCFDDFYINVGQEDWSSDGHVVCFAGFAKITVVT